MVCQAGIGRWGIKKNKTRTTWTSQTVITAQSSQEGPPSSTLHKSMFMSIIKIKKKANWRAPKAQFIHKVCSIPAEFSQLQADLT